MVHQTVLITGGAGFIGSHLCDALLNQDYQVVIVDNFNDFYNPELKRRNIAHLHPNPKFHLVEADIRQERLFETIFRKYSVDTIVHLAARAGVRPSLQNPQLYWDVNIMGSLNLLEAMKHHQIKHFVYASSSSVYGDRTEGPFKESDSTDNQVSPYGASKKALEILAATYAHLYKIKSTGLRFFTVYGPRNRPSMACSNFIEAAVNKTPIIKYGDGSTGRDYTYIDDIIQGIVAAIKQPLDYEIINLGNSSPVSLNELIATIEDVTGQRLVIDQQPIQPGDVTYTFADTTKAKRLLNWQAKTSLKEGLTDLYQWYKTANLK